MKPLKSAFGVPLAPRADGSVLEGESYLTEVAFWQTRTDKLWRGQVIVRGTETVSVREADGSASPQACYRSLRGRVANLRNALTKALGEKK